jgi:hypothetical protein
MRRGVSRYLDIILERHDDVFVRQERQPRHIGVVDFKPAMSGP